MTPSSGYAVMLDVILHTGWVYQNNGLGRGARQGSEVWQWGQLTLRHAYNCGLEIDGLGGGWGGLARVRSCLQTILHAVRLMVERHCS